MMCVKLTIYIKDIKKTEGSYCNVRVENLEIYSFLYWSYHFKDFFLEKSINWWLEKEVFFSKEEIAIDD